MRDTIVALGTARGRGAIAVVRLSGALAHAALDAMCHRPVAADRRLVLRRLRDGDDLLDEALVVAFDAAASPTGEPYAELHLHGGFAVVEAVERWLLGRPGLRRAAPGEFSRRALAAGKADLSQIEGMADLVNAETDAQRRQALRLLSGGLSGSVAGWRAALIEAWALIEALIDFSEDDIPDSALDGARARLGALAATMRRALGGARSARAIRDGVEVAVVGAPNAGKSSLINALLARDVSLTSPAPGTTRDVIEARLDLRGYLVTVLDTAGLRAAADPLEAAGIARARRRAAEADVVMLVVAPDAPAPEDAPRHDILIWNKADLAGGPGLNISALSGAGLDDLLTALAARIARIGAEAGPISAERHEATLRAAIRHVETAATAEPEIAVEELRAAAARLDGLLGAVDGEDILDEIFARFCIGK